jgi:hypothetical protein
MEFYRNNFQIRRRPIIPVCFLKKFRPRRDSGPALNPAFVGSKTRIRRVTDEGETNDCRNADMSLGNERALQSMNHAICEIP